MNANDGFSVTAVEPEDISAEEKSPAYPYNLSYTPPSLIKYACHCILYFPNIDQPPRNNLSHCTRYTVMPSYSVFVLRIKSNASDL